MYCYCIRYMLQYMYWQCIVSFYHLYLCCIQTWIQYTYCNMIIFIYTVMCQCIGMMWTTVWIFRCFGGAFRTSVDQHHAFYHTHKDFNVQTTVPTNRCQVAVIFWWTRVEERAKKEGMKETKAKKLRERERRDWERRFCLWPASCRTHIQDQNSNMAAPSRT